MLVGHWHLRGVGSWVIEERSTRAVIGRVGFWHPPSWPGVELTWLIRRSHWGQGFATEAAQRALQWAKDHTRLTRIVSLIHPDNCRSIRVAAKLGQTRGTQREVWGILHDEYQLELKR
jgi:RimJ/RimL family protein N-acetyltransferase